jgi:hypothetical protein
VTSYLRARYVEEPSWDVMREPMREPMTAAVLFLSWLPLLLCGARTTPGEIRFSHGPRRFVAIVPVLADPAIAACSCGTWGWGGALCDAHRGSE